MPPTMSLPPAPPASSAPAAQPPGLHLPHPRHASRLPPGLTPEDWQRLRQNAHALPQVLSPNDLDDGSDAAYDERGWVQISRSAAGGRPSRWIAPAHIELALAQLAATPPAPTLRSLMQQRAAQLDSLGLRREAQGWTRLAVQPLLLAHEGWRIELAHRVPQDEAPVWAFFRDGEVGALRHALGQAPAYEHAAELQAQLNRLVARSEAMGSGTQLASLLPRLQAECAVAQPLPDLIAALTRAQDRWEQQVEEQDQLSRLGRELAFQGYPDSFEAARKLGRKVTLYLGPPNSGKT